MIYDVDRECKTVIKKIKAICNAKGIKPNELAKRSNIATSTISYILNGKTQPQIYTLLQLCNALDITMEELFSKTKSENNLNKKARRNTALGEEFEADDLQISEMLVESLSQIQLTDDEMKLVMCYRYFPDEKKELLKTYTDMLQQYREIEDASMMKESGSI
ncbi:MAG: helix-turn-helix transcriptional regulator [Eubacteriales bacterium]|nr:helix-turn-helix transcriptional regulator [Eubacteriales bacterium]